MELSGTVQLTVVPEADRDRYWVAEEARRLQRELRSFAAKPAASDAPAEEGDRGLDPGILGSLMVQLGPALDSLGAMLNAVLVWVGARPQRTVHVKIGESEIDICGATPEESRELIRVFVQNQHQAVEDRSKAKPVEKGKHK